MNYLNSVLIEGELVRDPVMRPLKNGTPMVTMPIDSKDIEVGTNLLDIQADWKLAKTCLESGYKGRGIRVQGRLRQDRSIKENGEEELLPRIYVVAEWIEFKPDFKKAMN
jgi:single-strand DNA-binding protein